MLCEITAFQFKTLNFFFNFLKQFKNNFMIKTINKSYMYMLFYILYYKVKHIKHKHRFF